MRAFYKHFPLKSTRRSRHVSVPPCRGLPSQAIRRGDPAAVSVRLRCRPPRSALGSGEEIRTILARVCRCSSSAKASATRPSGYVAEMGSRTAPDATSSTSSTRIPWAVALWRPSVLAPISAAPFMATVVWMASGSTPRVTARSSVLLQLDVLVPLPILGLVARQTWSEGRGNCRWAVASNRPNTLVFPRRCRSARR